MSRALSTTAVTSQNAAQTEEVWLCLLTIEHTSLSEPLRFVNNKESVVSRDNLFLAFPFEIELPGANDDGSTPARLQIDNTNRDPLIALRELTGPLSVTIEVILAAHPDTVEVSIPGLTLRAADWDAASLTATLEVEDILSEPVSLVMTPARFPALT